MLTVGSLFAGIGGLELGLERTGYFKTIWQIEIDPYATKVLEKHWPDVQRYSDIRTVQALPYVDLICGGFPCQDISNAGKRAGLAGNRSGLWIEFARIIRMVRPSYVLVENVSALRGRGLGRVLGDLAACGYDAEWDCIPASAVGAPHQRDRIFIVAYLHTDSGSKSGRAERKELSGEEAQPEIGGICSDVSNCNSDRCGQGCNRQLIKICKNGAKIQSSRQKELANPNGERFTQWSERDCEPEVRLETPRRNDIDRCSSAMADACCSGNKTQLQIQRRKFNADRSSQDVAHSNCKRFEEQRIAQPNEEEVAGLECSREGELARDVANSGEFRYREQETRIFARRIGIERFGWWTAEPDVGGMVDGFSSWLDRSQGQEIILNTHKSILAYGNEKKKGARKELQELWNQAEQENIQWQIGGLQNISSAEILFPFMRKLKEASTALDNLSSEGTEIQEGAMRILWNWHKPSCASHRPKHQKQSGREHTDSVQSLSQLLAQHSQEAWMEYCREHALPTEMNLARVAHGIPARVDRLRCLGNAVVPQVAEYIGELIVQFYKKMLEEIKKFKGDI